MRKVIFIIHLLVWPFLFSQGHLLEMIDNATTITPLTLLQVTPPSPGSIAVTSRPPPPTDPTHHVLKNSAERFMTFTTSRLQTSAAGNATPASREHFLRQKSLSSSAEGGSGKDSVSGQYQIIRGSPHTVSPFASRSSGDTRQQREKESLSQRQNDRLSPTFTSINELEDGDELIQGPKQPYPPVPGAGYIPPATSVGNAPQIALGFQQEREVPRVEYVTADCFNNYMKITVQFNGSFDGLVYSTGYAHDVDCVYVNGSGQNRYEFPIRLNRCGTLGRPEFQQSPNEVPDRNHFMWNTITVQYNPEIEEDWDEHFQVTCEYGYEFRRTVTFPVVGVEKNTASPYLVTLSPPQCYMEVRSGFGPTGGRLTGPVTVGDPLTLMIHMESDSTEFDVAVSSCYAHNGAKKRLQLIDSNGCILKEQLMSPFRGIRSVSGPHHVALYAYFKAFRFTSSPALYLECDVHMCHGTCPAQRCHWKTLTKRSAPENFPTVEASTLMSENISLFQALQVLQETPDTPASGKLKPDETPDNIFCIPVLAVAAVSTSFLAFLLLATVMCVFLCLRLRRMKATGDVPGLNNYMTSAYFDKEPSRKRL